MCSPLARMYLKDDSGGPRQFLTSRLFAHYMILLLARCLVPVAMADISDPLGMSSVDDSREYVYSVCLDDIRGVTRTWSANADILNELSGAVDEFDFRGDVRRIWHRKREELEQLSPSIAPHRQTIIDLWTSFGKKCDVDVNAPYDPALEIEEAAAQKSGRAKRCAWRECLCFGERPQHTLKVCKRCMKVLYCSSKCQKRYAQFLERADIMLTLAFSDWNEGGHKHACRRSD